MKFDVYLENSKNCIDGPLNKFSDIESEFEFINSKEDFKIKDIGISNLEDWNFDNNNNFSHSSGGFFKVIGLEHSKIKTGILLQDEIGTLGLIMCIYDETIHFLIQFKKEPGNIPSAQLSPTLQATLSNQKRKHGGKMPMYLDYFQNSKQDEIVINKLLPEQGYRYWRKYNNNLVIMKDYFHPHDGFMWMTLGQIYKFSSINNSINSCLRSALSLLIDNKRIPDKKFNKGNILTIIDKSKIKYQESPTIQNSVFEFHDKKTDRLVFDNPYDKFSVSGISISILGREVGNWNQPIIFDEYLDEYILLSVLHKGKRKYLLKEHKEPGYEFGFNFGPTHINKGIDFSIEDKIKTIFLNYENFHLVKKIRMSEEGGRFYNCEVNHCFYEINCSDDIVEQGEYKLFDSEEIKVINELGFLSMEGRSLLFFSNFVYN